MSSTVVVISASFGSGHDVAAADIARRLTGRGVTVRTHDFVDLLGPSFGPIVRESYARQLRYAPRSWGWALAVLRQAWAIELSTRACMRSASSRTADALAGASAVVSTYPLASLVLGRMRRDGALPIPAATLLTDLSVHPMWITPEMDLYLAPTGLAAAQAIAAGATRVRLNAPAVDRSRFHPVASHAERVRLRERFGLPVGERLALVASGSWGVGAVEATARDIARTGEAVPVIACGRNEILRRRLTERPVGPALGWVDAMPDLIRACDVVVTNAGGLTGLEAIACGVPLIAYRCLPGHGAANGEVLAGSGLGVLAANRDELAKRLADPWPAVVSPVAEVHPTAIFGYADPADLISELIGLPTTRVPVAA